ncbi:uncharacterized protein IWZ02DRAFT_289798 [Phyllosticta citriasiana]|uniref:uncharacterized protein n=1 Tax=Phyllosticta citriasiana TaxID=595635 RepID=UPI0030FD6047
MKTGPIFYKVSLLLLLLLLRGPATNVSVDFLPVSSQRTSLPLLLHPVSSVVAVLLFNRHHQNRRN